MNEIAAEFLGIGQEILVAAFIVFLRVGAAMAVLPAFGERSIPERVRLGLALAFTMVVTPAVAPSLADQTGAQFNLIFLLGSEVVIGLALGLTLRFFVMVLQITGAIAAQSTSLSQIFGTNAIEPLPAIGHVMVVSGLALAAMMGLHISIAEALIGSYNVFPAGVFPDPSIISDWGLSRVVYAFKLAFSLAAPFVIASFIYNLTLGVINKAMPQLMVAFVGAPAITAGGLIILFLSLPLMLAVWGEAFQIFLANPFRGDQ